MTPENQITILCWQITAAVFMGIDYFLPNRIRERIDKHVKNYFSEVQERVDRDAKLSFKIFSSQTSNILIGIAYIVIGVVCFLAHISIVSYSTLMAIVFVFGAVVFILFGLVLVFDKLFDFIVVIGLAGPLRLIATFMRSSPKGPLSAFGFICLCVSFFLTYRFVNV